MNTCSVSEWGKEKVLQRHFFSVQLPSSSNYLATLARSTTLIHRPRVTRRPDNYLTKAALHFNIAYCGSGRCLFTRDSLQRLHLQRASCPKSSSSCSYGWHPEIEQARQHSQQPLVIPNTRGNIRGIHAGAQSEPQPPRQPLSH
ncbi:unnamed protein product [Ixodes persulcatus]